MQKFYSEVQDQSGILTKVLVTSYTQFMVFVLLTTDSKMCCFVLYCKTQ